MTFRFPTSLKVMVPLILLAFAATLSAINLLYHAPRAERAAEEDGRKRLVQEMSRLQSTLEYLLLKGDLAVAQHEISVLAHNHDYALVMLTDDRDIVIASTRRAWLGQQRASVLPQFDAQAAAAAIRERRARVIADPDDNALLGYAAIMMGSERKELRSSRSGGLFLVYDLSRAKSEARAQVLWQALYWAGWVTALALVLSLVFHFLLTRRTERLVSAAEQLAAGNLAARSGLAGDDELGRLSRAFDAMAREIAETQGRLREDLAERKRADEALRVSEASYRAIFDAAEDAIFVHDIETGAIVDANPRACAAFGYSREELRRLSVGQLSSGEPPYTQEDAMQLIAHAADGEPQCVEWHCRSKDGRLHWDEVFVKSVTINGQKRMLALTRDITARKRAEAALRASEEQYRAIFNASIDGLALWDASARIVDANPALWRMFGCSQNAFSASPHDRFNGPGSHPAFIRAVAAGRPSHAEFIGVREDGADLHLEVHAIPMQYQGRPHALTIARDITDKKQAADQLERQREALHQREKLAALGSLLAGVAHELNNPLSVVVARAVLLEEQGDPATQVAATKIRAAAERCARIVRTFLAMARQQRPERGAVAIQEVVSAALDIAAYAVRTAGIDVVVDVASDIPPILADADQLHQVLLNLIINAQQALLDQPAPRRIKVTCRFDAGADRVRILVEDNGPGIPGHLRARVFEPFFTTKPMGIGTGVGLAVSLGIVEAHGGTLTVDCPDGGGTVFSMALPAVAADAVSANAEPVLQRGAERLVVLVVDDEPSIRETLAEILTDAGHRVVLAASGREALDRLSAERYDVILTDVRMPDLDGYDLCREIERRWPERARRVIFLTGDTLASTRPDVPAERGRPVIEKPFLPSDVLRIVAELGRKRGRRAKPSVC